MGEGDRLNLCESGLALVIHTELFTRSILRPHGFEGFKSNSPSRTKSSINWNGPLSAARLPKVNLAQHFRIEIFA